MNNDQNLIKALEDIRSGKLKSFVLVASDGKKVSNFMSVGSDEEKIAILGTLEVMKHKIIFGE